MTAMPTVMSPHDLLHTLWSKAVGTPGYDKSEWKQLESLLRDVDKPSGPVIVHEHPLLAEYLVTIEAPSQTIPDSVEREHARIEMEFANAVCGSVLEKVITDLEKSLVETDGLVGYRVRMNQTRPKLPCKHGVIYLCAACVEEFAG